MAPPHSRANSSSFVSSPGSAGGRNGGGGVGVSGVEEENREAIRARDERERDLAVRQRRSVDLASGKEVEVQRSSTRQHHGQQQQRKKEADGDVEKVRAREVRISEVAQYSRYCTWPHEIHFLLFAFGVFPPSLHGCRHQGFGCGH